MTPLDLLTPKGRLVAAVLWPGENPAAVTERLTTWLTEGESEAAAIMVGTAHDKAVKAWAYARAYDEKYQSLVALPSTVEDRDEGSSSYHREQMDRMAKLRDAALAEFQELLDTAEGETVTVPPRSSVSALTQFRF